MRADTSEQYIAARRAKQKASKEQRVAAGLCANGASHGPATVGMQCDACRKKQKAWRLRREHPERAPAMRTHLDFWEAMQDLWFAAKARGLDPQRARLIP